MKIELIFDRSVLNLPGACVPALSLASAEELRVLVALSASRDKTLSDIAAMTGMPEERVLEALRFWEKSGVLALDGAEDTLPISSARDRKDCDRPSYTGADIERICADADTRELIDVCSAILGKTFTPTETESILYLRDGLRLDFEYIVRLCKYCHDIGKPALRYIEKVGISLYDSGAVTVGALEAYIEKEERKGDMEYRIRGLFGIGERALTPKEREYLSVWTVDWKLPFEIIELGYYEMMATIQQPKIHYEHRILKKWVDAGCRTKEEIEAFQASHKKSADTARKKSAEPSKPIGFDLDEFFAAATLRAGETPADGSAKNS